MINLLTSLLISASLFSPTASLDQNGVVFFNSSSCPPDYSPAPYLADRTIFSVGTHSLGHTINSSPTPNQERFVTISPTNSFVSYPLLPRGIALQPCEKTSIDNPATEASLNSLITTHDTNENTLSTNLIGILANNTFRFNALKGQGFYLDVNNSVKSVPESLNAINISHHIDVAQLLSTIDSVNSSYPVLFNSLNAFMNTISADFSTVNDTHYMAIAALWVALNHVNNTQLVFFTALINDINSLQLATDSSIAILNTNHIDSTNELWNNFALLNTSQNTALEGLTQTLTTLELETNIVLLQLNSTRIADVTSLWDTFYHLNNTQKDLFNTLYTTINTLQNDILNSIALHNITYQLDYAMLASLLSQLNITQQDHFAALDQSLSSLASNTYADLITLNVTQQLDSASLTLFLHSLNSTQQAFLPFFANQIIIVAQRLDTTYLQMNATHFADIMLLKAILTTLNNTQQTYFNVINQDINMLDELLNSTQPLAIYELVHTMNLLNTTQEALLRLLWQEAYALRNTTRKTIINLNNTHNLDIALLFSLVDAMNSTQQNRFSLFAEEKHQLENSTTHILAQLNTTQQEFTHTLANVVEEMNSTQKTYFEPLTTDLEWLDNHTSHRLLVTNNSQHIVFKAISSSINEVNITQKSDVTLLHQAMLAFSDYTDDKMAQLMLGQNNLVALFSMTQQAHEDTFSSEISTLNATQNTRFSLLKANITTQNSTIIDVFVLRNHTQYDYADQATKTDNRIVNTTTNQALRLAALAQDIDNLNTSTHNIQKTLNEAKEEKDKITSKSEIRRWSIGIGAITAVLPTSMVVYNLLYYKLKKEFKNV